MKARVAVVTTNRGAFDFREYSVPDPAPDSAIVKMICCNICGSDLHLWRGDARPLEEGLPQILGHEMVGTIHKLGTKVKTDSLGKPLQEGDSIIYSFYRQCGNCYFCNTREAACPDLHKHWIGVSSDDPPHFHAGYGEYYHLGPGHWVFKVPDNLSDDMASPVNCAGSTIFAGLDKIEIRPGDTVVVQGAGGLGLYAASMAKERGAGRIIAIDAFEQRLSLAEKFGADQLL
ncbi:MAG: alcohol dehydrogenase catalytic domain-containing protein, partial [Planctomycetota bacterium]|nr:alcohol dehydrogenase catalytic domain-containing protein [Planctomycetota bacterium]